MQSATLGPTPESCSSSWWAYLYVIGVPVEAKVEEDGKAGCSGFRKLFSHPFGLPAMILAVAAIYLARYPKPNARSFDSTSSPVKASGSGKSWNASSPTWPIIGPYVKQSL